jgi:hypothetical protein
MPTKLSKYQQSIFDITAENFGTLDNLIDVIRDNRISLSDNLLVNTELAINSENLGDADIKNAIINQGLEFNNKYEAAATLTVDTTLITVDSIEITVDAA